MKLVYFKNIYPAPDEFPHKGGSSAGGSPQNQLAEIYVRLYTIFATFKVYFILYLQAFLLNSAQFSSVKFPQELSSGNILIHF